MRNYLIILLMLVSVILQAQDTDPVSKKEFDIGLGLGMDYGGIGIRGTFQPIHLLALFGAVGYNFNTMGVNAGAQWRFPLKRNVFFLTGMYGYNAVLMVTGDIEDKATYYGVTAGAGYQLRMRHTGNYWNFELLVPFRNSNFHDDYDALQTIGVDLIKPLPVAFSVGYHFKIRQHHEDANWFK